MSIYIGDSTEGERVSIPVFHTGIYARSGMGKTTLIKDMIAQAVAQGYRVLIFDSKATGTEFDGIGKDVPFYLEQSADPDVYRSLIEGVRVGEKGNMEYFRGGFIEICEPEDRRPAKDFADIGRNLQAKLDDHKRINGRTRSMYREIQRDHNKLMEMLAQYHFDEHPAWLMEDIIEDIDRAWAPILRMPIHDLPNLSLQGLVVRSVIEQVLKSCHDMVVVIDEAPNFVNQNQYNPAKLALQRLDAQGRSKKIFGWYTGQTLTGFDKKNMKNLEEWILGGEMERNERNAVYDTLTGSDAIPGDTRPKKLAAIKNMKVREFFVMVPGSTTLVTVPKILQQEPGKAQGEGDNKPVVAADDTSQDGVVPRPLPAPLQADEEEVVVVGGQAVRFDRGAASDRGGATGRRFYATNLLQAPVRTGTEQVNLEEKHLIVNVSHSDKVVASLTTESKDGCVIWILSEAKKAMRGSEICSEMAEYGLPQIPNNFSRDVADSLVRKGWLIYENTRYRLPRKIEFRVRKVEMAR